MPAPTSAKDLLTIEDKDGNKLFVKGSIKGLAIKVADAGKKRRYACIDGLDSSWIGKKILCILLEGED